MSAGISLTAMFPRFSSSQHSPGINGSNLPVYYCLLSAIFTMQLLTSCTFSQNFKMPFHPQHCVRIRGRRKKERRLVSIPDKQNHPPKFLSFWLLCLVGQSCGPRATFCCKQIRKVCILSRHIASPNKIQVWLSIKRERMCTEATTSVCGVVHE